MSLISNVQNNITILWHRIIKATASTTQIIVEKIKTNINYCHNHIKVFFILIEIRFFLNIIKQYLESY